MTKVSKSKKLNFTYPKSPTGIRGLDDITTGGIPKNSSTLLAGKPGCGKTVMAMEFLVNGIVMFNEPGVFITFEEKADELTLNVESLGFNLKQLISENKLYLEHILISRHEIKESGKYNIEGLFIRLKRAIAHVKAKRVVLDSLDTLFSGFDYQVLRSEFKRLFSWLKEMKVTALITAEVGNTHLTQEGLGEYVVDCVIVLDNRVTNQIATRRLRIIKYRGSMHGNNEYPFILNQNGVTVFPSIAEAIQQKTSSKRISSGLVQLDDLLGKKGFYVGSSILISGTAGTGKTSIAAAFANSVCNNKERCLFCAFEEAPNQIIRNMRSIGMSLDPLIKSERLHFYYSRPTLQNLELHFIAIKKIITEIKPSVVILDPITNLMTEGPNSDIRSMLTRFVDYLKLEQITVMFTAAITVGSIERNPSDEGISSMVDTWMMVQDIEVDAKRQRSLCVMKSRGMPHSNEIWKFIISSKGIRIEPILNGEKNSKRRRKELGNLSTSNSPEDFKESART
jgi:circadian clock protein KaiC